MKKSFNLLSQKKSLLRNMRIYLFKSLMLLAGILFFLSGSAQNKRAISGTVFDEQDRPIIGATVVIKGTQIGTVTNIDGNFSLDIPVNNQTIIISFIGMKKKEVDMTGKNKITFVLKAESVQLGETVVVGYGQQKKESIVGAISQTKGEVLQRASGVSDVGMALTGNLPGVVTIASSGMPGEEDPQILIRAASSWNNSEPLILVDGVERPMSAVDIGSVETISVLKDASATAVFGVKGANGVILITTKRGHEGGAKINVAISTTMKVPSK